MQPVPTRTVLLATAVLAATPLAAQELPDATPWRQGIEYRIEARLDEADEVLRGRARVRYRNDSPDTLEEFYFHLYLNAFRPNSLWARTDLEAGITTFQELGPDEHAFERLRSMRVGGEPVELFYPFAPDSTIVGLRLPEPLGPGESTTLDYTWDARPSSVPRRQGRRGRQYDFAQWYPRVVVYDDEGWRAHPLYRQGEFYGEFATYDVTLEVADDQVIGATGVPVAGDPGWRQAAAPGTGDVVYQREWYGSLEGPPCIVRDGERTCGEYPARNLRPEEDLGHLGAAPAAGSKRVRWYAEDVHHFAWSTSPDYIYEQGVWDGVAIHVLYRPGDEAAWGNGVAVERTAVALEWLDDIYGDYAYPQVTNLHRIEGGGTEFPMVIMDGSASQGLILHEVGHIYAHGILANNEWYEGWLDEGMSSFQTTWFGEEATGAEGLEAWRGSQMRVLDLALRGLEEPVVQPAEDFSSYGVYGAMVYTKGSLVFLMLRELAGEEAFREILRRYYEEYRLSHVDSEAFEAVAEEVLGAELDWFFDQWLRGTGLVDYALAGVDRQSDERSYLTTVEVERKGELSMPVPVRLTGAEGETTEVWLDGRDEEERLTVRTEFLPERVEIDPEGAILDWNVLNNHWPGGFFAGARDWYVANPLEPVERRWRTVPMELFPLAWFNDAGAVLGVQVRSNQLGLANHRFLRIGLPALPVGEDGPAADATAFGSVQASLRDPVIGGRPRFGLGFEGFVGEGRYRLAAATDDLASPGGVDLSGYGQVYGVWEEAFLVPGRWTPGMDVGVEVGLGIARDVEAAGGWDLDLGGAVGAGSGEHVWFRGTAELSTVRTVREDWRVGARLFAGGALGRNPGDERFEGSWGSDFVPRERMFFLAGAGPLETLSNPWIRSAGAPFDLEGRMPGGGNLSGFHPGLPLPQILAASVELGLTPFEMAVGDDRLELRPVGFAGVATGGVMPEAGAPVAATDFRDSLHVFYSAGAALELGFAGSPLRLRLDLPVVISDPGASALDSQERFDFRWGLTVVGG